MSSAVSKAAQKSETPAMPVAVPRVVDPFRNPSYPQRVHFHEKAQLEASLRSYQARLQAFQGKLSALGGSHPQRRPFERLYHQMLGALDQMTGAVGRMPLETGALYDEDKERYEQAKAAFDRTSQRWETLGS